MLSSAADLPAPFDDLLDLDAVDELLSRRGLRTPFLRMAKDGRVIEPRRFTRSGGAGADIADQVADDAVASLLADGATAVLQGLHRVWPPIMEFAAALAVDLGHPVQVNAYVTPPASRGFAAHYDVHDVFVLQLAGSKRWLIHEPVLRNPLRTQPWEDRREAVAAAAKGPPTIETVLTPGDALYLPRGYIHAAGALGELSAHLTVGIHPVTRYALLEALVAEAADDERLRHSLPLGFDATDVDSLQPDLTATIEAVQDVLDARDVTAVSRRVRSRSWPAARPAPVAPLRQAAAVAAVGADTLVRRRPYLRCSVEGGGADGPRLVLPHTTVPLPAGSLLDDVRRLLEGPPVTAGELQLPTEAAIELVRTLLRSSVLVPVEP